MHLFIGDFVHFGVYIGQAVGLECDEEHPEVGAAEVQREVLALLQACEYEQRAASSQESVERAGKGQG